MGWAYTLGILVSFWVLVAVLLMLRYGGQHIGWGFQLQSPQFVFLLASVLFAFGLNLLGLFEISGRFMGYGSSLTDRPRVCWVILYRCAGHACGDSLHGAVHGLGHRICAESIGRRWCLAFSPRSPWGWRCRIC